MLTEKEDTIESPSLGLAHLRRKDTKLTQNDIRVRFRPADEETKTLIHGICSRFGFLPPTTTTTITTITDSYDENAIPPGYVLSVDFADALEDLVRLLEGDEGTILRQLGEMQVVARHLVPMFLALADRVLDTRSHTMAKALGTLLGLLILLMGPEGRIANRATLHLLYDLQRQYKRSFEEGRLWRRVLRLAALSLEQSDGDSPFNGMLSGLLKLICNVLAISDCGAATTTVSPSSSSSPFASAWGRHERVIVAMHECRLVEFLIVAAATCNDREEKHRLTPNGLLFVEIFHHLLCHADPLLVHQAGNEEGLTEKAFEDDQQRHRTRAQRHGRFTGAYVVRLSTGENLVLAQNRMMEEFKALDQGRRIQHRAKKFTIEDFGEGAVAIRSSELKVIGEIASRFLAENAFSELIINRGKWGNDPIPSDPLLLRLSAWTLRFWRGANLSPFNNANDPNNNSNGGKPSNFDGKFQEIAPLFDEEFLGRQARNLRLVFEERSMSSVLASLLFFRETMRIFDSLLAENPTEANQDDGDNSARLEIVEESNAKSTPSKQATFALDLLDVLVAEHPDFIVVPRIILTIGKRLSVRALAVVAEINHLLIKLLRRLVSHKGRQPFYVRRHRRHSHRQTRADESQSDAEDNENNQNSENNDSNGGADLVEFTIEGFLTEYTNEGVVDSLICLLREAPNLEPSTNRFVAILLNRLASDLQVPVLLFRASFLEAAHQILCLQSNHQWRHHNQSLLRVCEFVVRKFILAMEEHPHLAISIFFSPLHRGDQLRRAREHSDCEGNETEHTDLMKLPDHWPMNEKVTWLVRLLVDAEQSVAVSWLIGKLFDVVALSRPSKTDSIEEESAEMMTENDISSLIEDYYLNAQTNSLKAAFTDPAFSSLLNLCGGRRVEGSWVIPVGTRFDYILAITSTLQSTLRNIIEEASEEEVEEDENGDEEENADDNANENDSSKEDWRKMSRKEKFLKKSRENKPSRKRAKTVSLNNRKDYKEDRSPGDLPTTLVSDATTTTTINESRWAKLKRENFFLAAPRFDDDKEDHLSVEFGDEHHVDLIDDLELRNSSPKARKSVPLAIHSDDGSSDGQVD